MTDRRGLGGVNVRWQTEGGGGVNVRKVADKGLSARTGTDIVNP